jgi:hypothetical protein
MKSFALKSFCEIQLRSGQIKETPHINDEFNAVHLKNFILI